MLNKSTTRNNKLITSQSNLTKGRIAPANTNRSIVCSRKTFRLNGFNIKLFAQHYMPLPLGGSAPLSKTWLLGSTRVGVRNGISIGLAVFAGFTNMTNRQTNRQTDNATPCTAIGRHR